MANNSTVATYSGVAVHGANNICDIAQSFIISSQKVDGSASVTLTAVDLYFNFAGTSSPMPLLTLRIAETMSSNGIMTPNLNKVLVNSEVALTPTVNSSIYSNSTIANAVTSFTFSAPLQIKSDTYYAILLKYGGNSSYKNNAKIWKREDNKYAVDVVTHKALSSAASTAAAIPGTYFEYTAKPTSGSGSTSSYEGSFSVWNAIDLKYKIWGAKYAPTVTQNTVVQVPPTPTTPPVTVNVITGYTSYLMYKDPYEFITFNTSTSNNVANVVGGELVWQKDVIQSFPITVKDQSTLITTPNGNFTSLFGNTDNRYIAIYSNTDKNIRKVVTITSNTSLTVDYPVTITNAAASFSKVAAGQLNMVSRTLAFGKSESAIVIANSNANSTLRFVSKPVDSLTIAAGGTGYSNSDYVLVYNGGANTSLPAGANAVANLTTNSIGGITSVTLTNKGYGFQTTPTVAIKIANGASNSTGSGATITPSIGATILAEKSNAAFSNCDVINVPINRVKVVVVDLEQPTGTSYDIIKHYSYYATPDSVVYVSVAAGGSGYANGDQVAFLGSGTGGKASITTDSVGTIVSLTITAAGSGYSSSNTVASVVTGVGTGANLVPIIGQSRYTVNAGQMQSNVDLFDSQNLATATNAPLILSRSNEVVQPNSTFTTAVGNTVNTNISSVVEIHIASNNQYSTVDITTGEADVFFEKFAINNDYTNENTGHGAAVAKHISDVISLDGDSFAEDIRVYIDAYRPANTDIKVFAKVHSAKDTDAFTDKDWTLLVSKDNNGNVHSTAFDYSDIIEFTYGFPAYPNTSITASGKSTTTLNSANVIGSGSAFNTELAAGDLVRIHPALFPNNYLIDVVASVTNSSLFTLQNQVVNNDVVGSGMTVKKVGYKKQAFNDYLSSNVVTYYDSNMGVQRGYNQFAIKIVFLSENGLDVPKVDGIRAIAVTA